MREAKKESWKMFSKYHYLSSNLPGGKNFYFGLFLNDKQVGFQCFSNYVPHRKGTVKIYHFNRTVVHPDYVGFGLGGIIINKTSKIMKEKGYRIMAKFSSLPVYNSLIKDKDWKYTGAIYDCYKPTGNMKRQKGFRKKVKCFTFEFRG